MNEPVERCWGSQALWLKLQALDILLAGLSERQHSSLQEMYHNYVIEPTAMPDNYSIKCKVYRLAKSLSIPVDKFDHGGIYTILKNRQQDTLLLIGYNFKAQVELNQIYPTGSIGVAKEQELAQVDVIENFLRIYVAYQTLQHNGLLLHSAGLIIDDQAYIFTGPSNVGKTTLTRKAYQQGAGVLSDDINQLLPGQDGYQAHAVPFTGEFGRTLDHSGGQDAYPVAGIILLEQGKKLMTKTVTTADAVAGLLTGCPFVNTDAEESSRLFDAVINLVAALPVIRLVSSRDDDVADIMVAVTKKLQSVAG